VKRNYTSIGKGYASRRLYGPRVETVHQDAQFGSYKSWHGGEEIGIEYGEIELLVDIEALAKDIGWRALVSKSGTSQLKGGAVIARVIKRRKELK